MTFDSPSPPLDLNFDQLYLEIPAIAADFRNPLCSTSGARRRAEINQRCLDAVLPWLQDEQAATPRVWPQPGALPSFWDVVNGTAISIDIMGDSSSESYSGLSSDSYSDLSSDLSGDQSRAILRLVLIPTEAIDLSELRVPQEWVDIPTWAADYYLSVQVNLAEDWVRIVGYVTHQRLKMIAAYDASDRSYGVNTTDLIQNINVLWLAPQFCPEASLRAELPPLPHLHQSQAENLLARFGHPAVVWPRLEMPVALWGSLLAHGGWRQRLYEKRQGLPEQWSIQQWLQSGVSAVAAQWGWGQSASVPAMAGTRSAASASPRLQLSRQLTIAGQPYELRVFPVSNPMGNPSDRVWRFELRCTSNRLSSTAIPLGLTLRLLTEDLQPFAHHADTATTAVDALYVDVILEPGEGLVWETVPLPENYDREILRF